ncbi:MAG: right-handed parallel beta-helix repeat-containing protein [bacterium]|nr:right-handed parallel beta-helix repeat-containing protein [bacterium]
MKSAPIIACLAALALLAARPAAAAIRYVDATAGLDTNDGLTWTTAKRTIQASIDTAAPGDQIWVTKGRYSEAIVMRTTVSLYGGFRGGEQLLDERTGDAADRTVIDGGKAVGGKAATHVVEMRNLLATTLDGFVIQGGKATGSGDSGNGGGIYCVGSGRTCVVSNCSIIGNYAVKNGGGIMIDAFSTVTFEGCTISGNISADLGGGVYLSYSEPTFTDCQIRGNRTIVYGGGLCGFYSNLTMTGCTVANNSAGYGAGLCVFFSSPSITGGVFTGNLADYYGGAIYYFNSAGSLAGSLLSGNESDLHGGAVMCEADASPVIEKSILSGNRATGHGGALYCAASADVSLTNCLLSGNVGGLGGAVACFGSSLAALRNCTVNSNTGALEGGGVYLSERSAAQMTNTIFARNSNHAVYESDADELTTATACLFYANPEGDYLAAGTRSYTGAAAIDAGVPRAAGTVSGDPAFVQDREGVWTETPVYSPLTRRTTYTDALGRFTPGSLVHHLVNPDVNGPREALITSNTLTTIEVAGDQTGWVVKGDRYRLSDYRPGYGSAAIDMGDAGGAPATDIAGNPRPVDVPGAGAEASGAEYDIGAWEAQLQPELSVLVGPPWLDFGVYYVGHGPTVERVVTIRNEGQAPLTGLYYIILGENSGDFKITNDPLTTPLDPGQVRDLWVAFEPLSLGPKSAYIFITSNDSDEHVAEVGLAGEGIPFVVNAARHWELFE